MNLRILFLKAQGGSLMGRAAALVAWVLAVAAVTVGTVSGAHLFTTDGAPAASGWLFGVSVAALMVSLAYLARSHLGVLTRRLAGGLSGAIVGALEFPVVYLRDQLWWAFFSLAGCGMAYGLYQLAVSQASPWHLYLAAICAVASGAGLLVHLLRHKWAGVLSIVAGVLLIAPGLWLATCQSEQIDCYNKAMRAGRERDLASEQKWLDASLSAYQRGRQKSQLWKLIFPEPSVYLAARTSFHKGNVLAQTPNKGKQAYEELARSLTLNPGNRYIGLTAEEAALYEVDARRAQRNLEKLIRSGQAGNAGMPHGKQGQGQNQQPGDKRDPGREPSPGAGRMPRNTL